MSWMAPDKNWCLPGKPVVHVINKVRHSQIVFGAIGNCLNKSVFACMPACDQHSFHEFLKLLVQQIPKTISKPYLILDNHRAHHAIINRELLAEHFNVMWLPGYSSLFNSIEQVWGIAKINLRRRMLDIKVEVKEERWREEIMKTFEEIGEETLKKMINGNRKYLFSLLS